MTPKLSKNKGPFYYARLDPFGDPGQSFCSIFTKIGTEGAFMCLRMMLKGFFGNINLKPKNRVKGSQGVVELFME